MQRPRIRVAWWLPLLLSSAFAACADGEELSPGALTPVDGAGAGGESQSIGDGGVAASLGGGGQSPGAGRPGAGVGGDSGAASGIGGEGEGAAAGAGGVGSVGEQLPLCARLSLQTTRATEQSRAFATAAYFDCRVSWVVPVGPNLDEYRQQLTIWNLEFWGCQGLPVTTFGLVWGTPQLSAGDASALIDTYLTATDAAKAALELSPGEYKEMKSALERLAEPYITNDSTEPSKPACDAGSGGAGGVAAGAGAGGSP